VGAQVEAISFNGAGKKRGVLQEALSIESVQRGLLT